MSLPLDNLEVDARKRAMELFSKADRTAMQDALDRIEPQPQVKMVRGPETGLIMLKGRMGGGGSPFNLGEASVSRATVRLEDGTIGHGHVLGTDKGHARLAAIFDALWQGGSKVAEDLANATARELEKRQAKRNRQAAATRVDFFTLARGED